MANIDNWLAKPNIVVFKIVSLVIVAACAITCFVIPPAWSQELKEIIKVESCTFVEMCWFNTSQNSEECLDNGHFESIIVKNISVNVTKFESSEWSKCIIKCNSTAKAVLRVRWNESSHAHLPAKITVAIASDERIVIFIKDPAEKNHTNKHLCSAPLKGGEISIQLNISEVPEIEKVDNVTPSSMPFYDDTWLQFIKEHWEKCIARGIIAVVLLLLIYISLRRLSRLCKHSKTSHTNKAVVIPLEKNIIPNERCVSNPTFMDPGYTNSSHTNLSNTGPSLTNSNFKNSNFTNSTLTNPSFTDPSFTDPSFTDPSFTNPTFTNLSFTHPGFTNKTLPNPRKSAVPIISRSAIAKLRKIGEGYFGKVFEAQLQVTSDKRTETVAIKMLKQPASLEAEKDFMQEVKIMSSFKHPNILSLLGLCFCETLSAPWMIFEFMSQGDLASVLRRVKPRMNATDSPLPWLPQDSLVTIALHISKGMKYLANQKFVHRDLACRNCLVGENFVVKIADFGMSRDVHQSDYYKANENKPLPVRWMAPESIKYGTFTLASDVWSFGVVLWELYNYGERPYSVYCNEEVLKFILDGHLLNIPNNCPTIVASIMRACWRKYIEDRISFSEICEQLSHLRESELYYNVTAPQRPPASLVNSARSISRNAYRENDMDNSLNDYSDYLTPILMIENVPHLQNEFRSSKRFLVNKNRLFSGPADKGLKGYDKSLGTFSNRQNQENVSISTKF